MTTITVTIPSPGGTATIVDSTAIAVNSLTVVVANQTLLLEKLFGPAGSTPINAGGLTSIAGTASANLQAISQLMIKQNDAIRELQMATGAVSKSVETLTGAVGTIQYTMTKGLINSQLATADQIVANKFNQATTNAALERAELPPTEVKPEALGKQVADTYTTVNVMEAQARVIGAVTSAVDNATAEGLATGKKWVLDSAFGQWATKQFGEAKLAFASIFAKEKAEEILKDAKLTVVNTKGNPNNTMSA